MWFSNSWLDHSGNEFLNLSFALSSKTVRDLTLPPPLISISVSLYTIFNKLSFQLFQISGPTAVISATVKT